MCVKLEIILCCAWVDAAALDSHLDLWAGCRRPAFLVCVQVFREQALDKDTAGANVTIVFVNFAYFQELQHRMTQSWDGSGKLTSHCFAWAQWGRGRARPGSSRRSRWYRRTPEKTTETMSANWTTAHHNERIHWFDSFYLASIVVYDEARVPVVEMLVCSHGSLQFLQQSAIRALSFGVHCGAHVVQHTHDARWVLRGNSCAG